MDGLRTEGEFDFAGLVKDYNQSSDAQVNKCNIFQVWNNSHTSL